jgi:flagellar biosynthesis/type III secretory pathway chaperone
MSVSGEPDSVIAASQALALPVAQQLQQLLALEFEALKEQDLDRFENLQAAKTDLLSELARLCPDSDALQANPAWQDLKEILVACRDMHRRNAMLIERKLDAIRGALRSLSAGHASSPVEVYDRLGKMARYVKGRGFNEA